MTDHGFTPTFAAPRTPALAAALALAITGLGIWTILAPSSVPGLTPPMM
jgi:hypothetical protein